MSSPEKFNYSYLAIVLIAGLIASNYYWYQKASEVSDQGGSILAGADFQKKTECAKYKDEIVKSLDSKTIGNLTFGGVLLELFYSPSLDTCISAHETITLQGMETMNDVWVIKDALTDEVLFRTEDQGVYEARLATYK